MPYWKEVLRRFGNIFFTILSVIVSFILLGMLSIPFAGGKPDSDRHHVYGSELSDNRLLSISLSGVIMGDENDGGALSFSDSSVSGYDIKRQLYDAAKDKKIKGVVL